MLQYSLLDANADANVSFGMPLSSCFDFCRYRYKHVNYRVRDRNDTDCTDHDYNLSSLKGKKSINKGRWTKEEVSVLCLRFNEQQSNVISGIDSLFYQCNTGRCSEIKYLCN